MRTLKQIRQFENFRKKGTKAASKLPRTEKQMNALKGNGMRNCRKAHKFPRTEKQREASRKNALKMGKMNLGKTQEKCTHWKGGISFLPYSPEFTESLKERIRARDGFECQNKNCKMTQEEHLIVYGFDLNIHHIDYEKMNCNETNLITVCHGCNSRANFNREVWKEFYSKIVKEKTWLPQ